MFTRILSFAFLAAVSVFAQSSTPTISAVGAKFFFENGTQYFIKGTWPLSPSVMPAAEHTIGVAYQLTDDDPLTNGDQCKLDAKQMADLGANTIRVYHIDPTANHDDCMKAFADVGIYVFCDLDTFDTAFDQVSHVMSSHVRGGLLSSHGCSLLNCDLFLLDYRRSSLRNG